VIRRPIIRGKGETPKHKGGVKDVCKVSGKKKQNGVWTSPRLLKSRDNGLGTCTVVAPKDAWKRSRDESESQTKTNVYNPSISRDEIRAVVDKL